MQLVSPWIRIDKMFTDNNDEPARVNTVLRRLLINALPLHRGAAPPSRLVR